MPRTSASDVTGGGFDTELTTTEVDARIDDANLIVSEELGDSGMSDARLEKIETYLARHLIRIHADPETSSESIGDAEFDYTGEHGEGLRATSPGQTAIMLDTTGTLADQSKPVASLDVPEVK